MNKHAETAREIAESVSKAWPNGYNHRDHFPKAVAIILPILERAYPQGKRGTAPLLRRLAANVSGVWKLYEAELRGVMGNTNYQVIQEFTEEARAVVEE